MSKATQKQLELIAALGFFEGKDISKEDAGAIIGSAREQGIKPDWSRKDASEIRILQIMRRRYKAQLKAAADAEEIAELEQEIRFLDEEIEESKEAIREEKEYARERIADIHADLESNEYYQRLTKKPTKAEVKAIVEALDQAKPNWESDEKADLYLIENLSSNFAHLGSNKPRAKKGKQSKKKSSRGCLILSLLVLCLAAVTVSKCSEAEIANQGNESESKTEATSPKIPIKTEKKKVNKAPESDGNVKPVTEQITELAGKPLDLTMIQYPASVVTTEKFELLNKEGKETPISLGTKIKIINRSNLGTLKMMIDGELFVGNEERLMGKVELD